MFFSNFAPLLNYTFRSYTHSVNDMCPAKAGEAPIKRGKVPAREATYFPVTETATTADVARRQLQRIIPQGPDACIDSRLASGYLNRPEVMEAIHVRDPGFCWAVCNTAPGWKYQSTRTNLPQNTYPLLVGSIQVTIFNGDWDACKFLSFSG